MLKFQKEKEKEKEKKDREIEKKEREQGRSHTINSASHRYRNSFSSLLFSSLPALITIRTVLVSTLSQIYSYISNSSNRFKFSNRWQFAHVTVFFHFDLHIVTEIKLKEPIAPTEDNAILHNIMMTVIIICNHRYGDCESVRISVPLSSQLDFETILAYNSLYQKKLCDCDGNLWASVMKVWQTASDPLLFSHVLSSLL